MSIEEAKQAVLDKLETFRKPYHHKFQLSGKCENCRTRITDLPIGKTLTNLDLMCPVITSEEVKSFRTDLS